MSVKKYESNSSVRRARKVRARVKASGRLRLSVFRSARHIYAQIIDDAAGLTLVAASTLDAEVAGGGNLSAAEAVGKLLAERAKKGKLACHSDNVENADEARRIQAAQAR